MLAFGAGARLLPVKLLAKFSYATRWHAFVTGDLEPCIRQALRSSQFEGSTAGLAAAEARDLITAANKAKLAESCTRTVMSRLVTMHKADTLAVCAGMPTRHCIWNRVRVIFRITSSELLVPTLISR